VTSLGSTGVHPGLRTAHPLPDFHSPVRQALHPLARPFVIGTFFFSPLLSFSHSFWPPGRVFSFREWILVSLFLLHFVVILLFLDFEVVGYSCLFGVVSRFFLESSFSNSPSTLWR